MKYLFYCPKPWPVQQNSYPFESIFNSQYILGIVLSKSALLYEPFTIGALHSSSEQEVWRILVFNEATFCSLKIIRLPQTC